MSWTFDSDNTGVATIYSNYTLETWDTETDIWASWRMSTSADPLVIDVTAATSWISDGPFTGDKFLEDLGNFSTSDKVLSGASFIGTFTKAGA